MLGDFLQAIAIFFKYEQLSLPRHPKRHSSTQAISSIPRLYLDLLDFCLRKSLGKDKIRATANHECMPTLTFKS